MNIKKELFDKIVRCKQLNQSECDTMKNLNIRSEIICRVLNERTGVTPENKLIVLDNNFKCKWYQYYKFLTNTEMTDAYSKILKEYINISNHVRYRSKYISKLRLEMKKFNKFNLKGF